MEDINTVFSHNWEDQPQEWQDKIKARARAAFGLIDPESLKYLGYTNYETWAVDLYLNYDRVREMAEQARKDGPACQQAKDGIWPPDRASVFLLAGQIEGMIDNPLGDDASMFSDLLTSALGRVNWTEIAEVALDSLPEEDED